MMVINVINGIRDIGIFRDILIIYHIRRRFLSHTDKGFDRAQIFLNGLNHFQEFRTQNEHAWIADLCGEQNILTFKSEIQWYNDCTQSNNAVIGYQPFQRVILKMHDIITIFNIAFFGQVVGCSIYGIIKLLPSEGASFPFRGRSFDKTDFIGKMTGMYRSVFRVVHLKPPVINNCYESAFPLCTNF